ncbi:hypothetical protein MTR_2g011740 [Medicago truncatula]|uniref:Uncharacterized protein n=1 Tax=Medicago truncatula TaxID=3880 RepID=A0A072V3V5_MEDTR|nr:hypothetical protein MTR_2g011740 [Medicago truncatula]
MLGKQRWKLLTNSDSLLTRVLKVRYFPINGFLDTNIGHSPSFTWRSIWSTIPILSLDYNGKFVMSLFASIMLLNLTKNTWNRELFASIVNAQCHYLNVR